MFCRRRHAASSRWERARNTHHASSIFRDATGNSAFDAYREQTLARLESEKREFEAFLDDLRQARDREEFEQYMASRPSSEPHEPGAAAGRKEL